MDPESKFLKDINIYIYIYLNYTTSQEHISKIERAIRVINERFRAQYHRFPYKIIPKAMIVAVSVNLLWWINILSPKAVLSEYYGLRIIMDLKLDYTKH